MLKRSRLFLIIIIIFLLLFAFKFLIPYIFDKSQISSINQNDVSYANVKSRSDDISLNQAKLSLNHFNSSGMISAKGTVEIRRIESKYYIILDKDFSVTNFLDSYIYLYRDKTSNNFDSSKALIVGKLKSNNGEQAYEITEEQYKNYSGEIVIWCKLFSFKVAEATLS